MNKLRPIFILVVVFLILTVTLSVTQTTSVKTTIPDVVVSEADQPIQNDSSTLDQVALQAQVEGTFGQLPLLFEENQGQWDEQVSYAVQGSDKTLYFTPEGITIALTSRVDEEDESNISNDWKEPRSLRTKTGKSARFERWVIKLDFLGANPNVRPIGENSGEAIISYFKGQPEQWHTSVPTYRRLVYHDLWPGIDLVYEGTVNRLKYHFSVQPGADPAQIRLAYRGTSDVSVNPAGQLVIDTPQGSIQDEAPIAYQNVDGKQEPVTISYTLENPGIDLWTYGFELGDYDPSLPLMLDPAVLVYAGYIGGSNSGLGWDIAIDGSGNAYIAGQTTSTEASFPVTVGPDLTFNGSGDAFVAKINPTGTGLVYAGYIGGSNVEGAMAIDIDGSGNAYVTGYTYSTEATFPVTVGPDLTHNGGVGDAFVAKINTAGTGLIYAGYIGGSSSDSGLGIAVDGLGNAYITGETGSSEATFPVTVGPDLTHNGGPDAFVTKVNQAGTGLIYSGYIGGSDDDVSFGIDIDNSGNAYITGYTNSSEAAFPVIVGPDLTHNGGVGDAFVAKINPAGTGLIYAGYIGGSDYDEGRGIAVDSSGNAYISGHTHSSEASFPVTVGPDLTYNGGFNDAFVAKINMAGTSLIYAGYIGGNGGEEGLGIAVDGSGYAYITGETNSTEATFPVTVGPDLTYNSGVDDAYIAKINETGTGLSYAGYIGGSGDDRGWGIAVDGLGNAYITGETYSSEATFPVTVGPDLTFNSINFYNPFVAKVSTGIPFLDLPFNYSYTNFATVANGSSNGQGPGRANAWLDHDVPVSQNYDGFLKWWFGISVPDPTGVPCTYGFNCYDSHNSTDFRLRFTNPPQLEPVLAASTGTILDNPPNNPQVTWCQVGDTACGNGFGNQVWIDHGNRYATLYGHLQLIGPDIISGTMVPDLHQLAYMGSTGDSVGTHLHFGVYYDLNDDGTWTTDEVVDPFGWDPWIEQDPWVIPSIYLWKQPVSLQSLVGGSGGNLARPSARGSVTIPANAIPTTVTVQLTDAPTPALAQSPYVSSGNSFWLRVPQWASGTNTTTPLAANMPITFTVPVTLTILYTDIEVLHLDEAQLGIFRWDESNSTWTALPTTVNTALNQAVALTNESGSFELQGPLICPTDVTEPDDNFYGAIPIAIDNTPEGRHFDLMQDEDWLLFEAEAGYTYVVNTQSLATGVDTVLELYDVDGLTLLVSDDNSGNGLASQISWEPQRSGPYFIRILSAPGSSTGCSSTYEVGVNELPISILLEGPYIGLVNSTQTFTATVYSITATQPITYVWHASDQLPITNTGGLTNVVNYSWSMTGTKLITVTASNAGGGITGTHAITIDLPSQANFVGSPTSGIAPLMVDFTNLSTSYFVMCNWDFGDGFFSNNCNDPSHNYINDGIYTVTLTVSGLGISNTLTRTNYITVYEPALADFSASPLSGIALLTVDFFNESTGDFNSCLWNFGDGNNSGDCNNPTHTFNAPGSYTVSLTISGPGGSDVHTSPNYINVAEYQTFLPVVIAASQTSVMANNGMRVFGQEINGWQYLFDFRTHSALQIVNVMALTTP